jgi:hypothetical protein
MLIFTSSSLSDLDDRVLWSKKAEKIKKMTRLVKIIPLPRTINSQPCLCVQHLKCKTNFARRYFGIPSIFAQKASIPGNGNPYKTKQ